MVRLKRIAFEDSLSLQYSYKERTEDTGKSIEREGEDGGYYDSEQIQHRVLVTASLGGKPVGDAVLEYTAYTDEDGEEVILDDEDEAYLERIDVEYAYKGRVSARICLSTALSMCKRSGLDHLSSSPRIMQGQGIGITVSVLIFRQIYTGMQQIRDWAYTASASSTWSRNGAAMARVKKNRRMDESQEAMDFIEACRVGAPLIIEDFLKAGTSPDTADNYGTPALHYAVQSGSLRAVQLLLQYGADPDSTDTFGNTALLLASSKDISPVIAKALIQAGAAPGITNAFGSSPASLKRRH